MTIEPRLLTRQEARSYLAGLEPEALGVAAVPAKSRKVRFDRFELDSVLNHLSSITLDSSGDTGKLVPRAKSAGVLDEWLGLE